MTTQLVDYADSHSRDPWAAANHAVPWADPGPMFVMVVAAEADMRRRHMRAPSIDTLNANLTERRVPRHPAPQTNGETL